MTKTEKLLNFVAKNNGATYEQMVQFLVGKRNFSSGNYGNYWRAQIFGTSRRAGLNGRFLTEMKNGTFKARKRTPNEPFYPAKQPEICSCGDPNCTVFAS